jgi:hypothetical protein
MFQMRGATGRQQNTRWRVSIPIASLNHDSLAVGNNNSNEVAVFPGENAECLRWIPQGLCVGLSGGAGATVEYWLAVCRKDSDRHC